MTLAELRTQFINVADDPDISSTQADAWLNSVYRLLCHEFDWPFMVGSGSYTVTSGTQETAFADFSTAITDFAKPLKAWIATSSTSDKVDLDPIWYEDRNIPGLSRKYYITPDNTKIGLIPTPTNSTDVVTLDYMKTVTDLAADSDSPAFVSDFHWILIWRALVYYQKQQREVSDEYEVMYRELLAAMLKFYKMPQAVSNPLLSKGTRNNKLSVDNPFRR